MSDFCLNDRTIPANIPPDGPDVDNRFDTFATTLLILAHNEVHDQLCPETSPSG